MDELEILFLAYMSRSKYSKARIATEILGISPQWMSTRWHQGIRTWEWRDVIAVAKAIGIPLEVLREQVKY